jgi:hypothetical protein
MFLPMRTKGVHLNHRVAEELWGEFLTGPQISRDLGGSNGKSRQYR